MHRCVSAKLEYLSGRVRCAAKESACFEVKFDIAGLHCSSVAVRHLAAGIQTDIDIIKNGHNKNV